MEITFNSDSVTCMHAEEPPLFEQRSLDYQYNASFTDKHRHCLCVGYCSSFWSPTYSPTQRTVTPGVKGVHDRNFAWGGKVSRQEYESADGAKRKHRTMVGHARIPHPEALDMHTPTHTHTQIHTALSYLRKHDLTSFLFAYRCACVRGWELLVVSHRLPWRFSLLLKILTKQIYVNRKEEAHFMFELLGTGYVVWGCDHAMFTGGTFPKGLLSLCSVSVSISRCY